MLSYFTPWPVHPEWHLDTVPPGAFTFDVDERTLHMWTEPLFSERVLQIGQSNTDTSEGLNFRCFTNADALTQFDATYWLEPFENGSDIIMRYVLDTEAWIAGPSLGHGSRVAVLLADLMLRHRKDRPRRLALNEVAVEPFGSDQAVVHVCQPDGVIRLIHVADETNPETKSAVARRFQIITAPLDGPHWGRPDGSIVVDARGVRFYEPNVEAGRFVCPLMADDVPRVFHDLAAMLWNDGEPIGYPDTLF